MSFLNRIESGVSVDTREVLVRRENFGPGKAGDWAYQIVASGALCEAKIDEAGTKCGQEATQTLDFDVFGQLEITPTCGKAHSDLIEERVREDLAKGGHITAFGINGFGRD